MKLILKKLIANILSAIQALTYTATENAYLDYCKCRRVGKVVYVYGISNGGINITSGSYYPLTRVGPAFRPSEPVRFVVDAYGGTQNISGIINTDGLVELYTTVSTSWWRYSVTYVLP